MSFIDSLISRDAGTVTESCDDSTLGSVNRKNTSMLSKYTICSTLHKAAQKSKPVHFCEKFQYTDRFLRVTHHTTVIILIGPSLISSMHHSKCIAPNVLPPRLEISPVARHAG